MRRILTLILNEFGVGVNREGVAGIITCMFRDYLRMLAEINGLKRGHWLMEPGKGFGSGIKWWAEGEKRNAPHNGLDLRAYRKDKGDVIYMDGTIVVPAAAGGEVLNVAKDFLGHSVFVSHGPDGSGGTLVSAYGHIVPAEGIRPGARLARRSIIGKLSEYEDMPVPAHLHFSLIRLMGWKGAALDWDALEASDAAMFLGP